MGDFFRNFFDTSDFPARWHCGNWSDFLGWLHVGSDIATFGAYFAIPIALLYFARSQKEFPYNRIFFLFAGFILACGTVHLIEAVIFWYPIYRVSGVAKFVTAAVSWATVIAIVRLLPQAISLPSLAVHNARLSEEVARREQITAELRQTRDELQRQKRELELIYDAAPVGMSLIDKNLCYVRINEYLARINGLPREAHHGRRISDVIPELSAVLEPYYEGVMQSGIPVLDREVSGRRQSDQCLRIWSVSYYPLRDDQGSVAGVSSVVQDITDQKEYEQRLRKSEQAALAANRSKSEFLANMSHEIRTPMAAILGYADVLLGHLADPDNRNCVLIIKRNGEHLLELINDILDLSRIEAGKLDFEVEFVPLPLLIGDVRSLMQVRADEKKLDFEIDFDGKVPASIRTDPTRLRQVLINLIGNAIKFTKEGSVRLLVKLDEFQRLDTNGRPAPDPRLCLEIIDTGIGMTDEQQSRLFRPFSQADSSVTRSYGGSGLGLAISKRLVNLLGGQIEVNSELGKGSVFRVYLPIGSLEGIELVEPDLSLCVREPIQSESVRRDLDCRVLVVDDRRDVRHITQHFLEKAGAKVLSAEDGQQGIDATIAARDRGQPFDLILMDMQMPVVDGLRATGELRSAGILCPIIALTADAMKGDRERCLNGGCDDYLTKPIDHGDLVSMVARYTLDISQDQLIMERRERAAALKATLSRKRKT